MESGTYTRTTTDGRDETYRVRPFWIVVVDQWDGARHAGAKVLSRHFSKLLAVNALKTYLEDRVTLSGSPPSARIEKCWEYRWLMTQSDGSVKSDE